MKTSLALFVVLALLTACASTAPRYQVGPNGRQQSRQDAEQTLANSTVTAADGLALDSPPRVISSRFPDYPQSWINANVVGTVFVDFTIEANGSVSNPAVVGSPPPELAALTLHAIMGWKFSPAMRGGVPVPVRARQKFEFKTE